MPGSQSTPNLSENSLLKNSYRVPSAGEAGRECYSPQAETRPRHSRRFPARCARRADGSRSGPGPYRDPGCSRTSGACPGPRCLLAGWPSGASGRPAGGGGGSCRWRPQVVDPLDPDRNVELGLDGEGGVVERARVIDRSRNSRRSSWACQQAGSAAGTAGRRSRSSQLRRSCRFWASPAG